MKFLLLRLCFFLLLSSIGMASVFAEPAQDRGENRGRTERGVNPADQERNARNTQDGKNTQDEAARKPPRLSPEERKALRQQINEAGHDIYHPKH